VANVTKYMSTLTKRMLTRIELIFWSILFVEFWVAMWILVFAKYTPPIKEAQVAQVSTAYGSLLLISLSSVAVSIAYTTLYASKAVRYVTKFTRLSPLKYLLENTLSSLIVLLVVSAVILSSVVAAFSWRFNVTILPNSMPGIAASTLLGALLTYLLGLLVGLALVVFRAPRSASFAAYLPLMLGFISYSALWVDFGKATYLLPYNCLTALCYYFYSGFTPLTGAYVMSGGSLVSVRLAAASLIAYIALLAAVDVVLLRKIYGVGVEEIRVV